MGKSSFKILHLSDVHLHDRTYKNARGNRPEITEAFNRLVCKGENYDLICITGDVFDGPYINNVEEEFVYEFANFFFDGLKKISGDNAPVLMCFGNHDHKIYYAHDNRDRRKSFKTNSNNTDVTKFLDIFFNWLASKESAEFKKLGCDRKKKAIYKNEIKTNHYLLKNFAVFVQKVIDGQENEGIGLRKLEEFFFIDFNDRFSFINKDIDETYKTFGIKYIKEKNVLVVIINTSWQNISSDILDGRLSMGQMQIKYLQGKIEAIIKENPNVYTITLMHNAFNSLGYSDVHSMDSKPLISIITEFSDLILCGHEHGELPPSLFNFEAYLLKTGGLMNYLESEPSIRNSYSVINLDFEKRELKRELFIFDPIRGEFISQNKETSTLFTNYNEYELYPKKARNGIINQQRNIEEYFHFMKNFGIDYFENMEKGDQEICNQYLRNMNKNLPECINCIKFFEYKERSIREFIYGKIEELRTEKAKVGG